MHMRTCPNLADVHLNEMIDDINFIKRNGVLRQ